MKENYVERYFYALCTCKDVIRILIFQTVEKSGCCLEIKGEEKDVCEGSGVKE